MGTRYVSIQQVTPKQARAQRYVNVAQTGGVVEMEDGISVIGRFGVEDGLVVFSQTSDFVQSVEVFREDSKLYQNGNTLLKYLPAEYEVQDSNDDLRQFLSVVAIRFDEFYTFLEDFTTLFDPDRCPAKYLPYLAKLIAYPLSTRGFESEVPSIRDAAVRRARRQLRTAVDVYKRKGLKEAFQLLFYGLGYYIELVELWTNNYVTFLDQIPAGGKMYHPVSEPNGWFKSPYFGIKLISINQQTVCTTGDEGQPWSFTTDDLQEITEAIHSVRPVHTVLWWLDYYFDMCDVFDQWSDVPEVSDIDWVPEDRVEYLICDPDDPVYFRGDPSDPTNPLLGDPRLDGVTREFMPQTNPELPGPTVAAVRLKRQQFRGVCHPGEWLEAEIGEYEFETEPYCTQVYRNAGELYRDGFNPYLRDGSIPTRDPSCFNGRNGGYGKDLPLAPFPGSLVPDRSGCYMLDEQFSPLYQIAEEAEDGIIRYFNTYEFNTYLDTMVSGMGIDPDMSPADPYTASMATLQSFALPIATRGNGLYVLDDAIWSFFGDGSPVITRVNFSGALPSSVDTVFTDGAELAPSECIAGHFDGLFFLVSPVTGRFYHFDPDSNTLTGIVPASLGRALHEDYASAQVGKYLYLFTSNVERTSGEVCIIDLDSHSVEWVTAPYGVTDHIGAVAVNQYVYVFASGRMWRFDTVTRTTTFLAAAPNSTRQPVLFARANGTVCIMSATSAAWYDHTFTAESAMEFTLSTHQWSTKRILRASSDPLPQLVNKAGRFYGLGALFGSEVTNAFSDSIEILTF